jgi:NAD(P)H-hydrate epimerase
VIDGLVGYRLAGPLRGAVAELVRWANAQAAPVLALDVPSGLDSTTGALSDPTVRAAATLTLALPKVGLQAAAAAPFVGELYLADIGVPPALYEGLGLAAPVGPLFAQSDLLRLR